MLKQKPDVIIDIGAVNATYASLADRVQQQTGIPYLLLDGTLTETARTFRSLGKLLGEESRAETLANYVDNALNEIREKVATVPQEQRPRVYYGRGPDGLQTGLKGSINVEALEFLGARNVAAESGARGGLATVSLEQVLTWNPQIIVTVDPHFRGALFTDPRWAGVDAVRNKRIHLSPHVPFGWFDFPPGPNRLIGLQWLAKELYPTLFDYDLRARIIEFYRLSYSRTDSRASRRATPRCARRAPSTVSKLPAAMRHEPHSVSDETAQALPQRWPREILVTSPNYRFAS
ncbi:MAG: ABC transporter substrate-binding protein [Burkholderiales bacterium]|nr:ABC transporter substrate-binding protein [Pseudomonadota bacterium]